MSAELQKRLLNLGRAVTLAGLLGGSSGAFESPKFFGQNSKRAHAAELNSPLEQELLPIHKEGLSRYSSFLAKKDLAGLERYLFGDNNFTWRSAGSEPFKYRGKVEFLALLKQALARSEPRCVGYKLGRRATDYRILFENFSLGNNPDASGYSYIVLGIVPYQDGVSSLFGGVEEVAKKDLVKEKKEVQPCNTEIITQPEPKLETKPELKPEPKAEVKTELLPALAKTKVVYIAGKDDKGSIFGAREDLYIANLDGMEERQLTDDDKHKRDVKFLPSGKEVVYAEAGRNERTGGIVKLNIETGEKKYLTHGTYDFCPSPSVDGEVLYHRGEVNSTGGFAVSFENTYSVDSSGKEKQITNDTVGSSEACPVPSPDGKHIAISTRIFAGHGKPSGIAIYPKEELKNFDPDKLPKLIEGGRPLFWSPDGRWLYINRYHANGRPYLYRAEVSTGEVESLLATVSNGVSLSPDGQWFIVPVSNSRTGSSEIIAMQPGKVTSTRALFTVDNVVQGIAIQPKVFVPEKNTIILFPGLGSTIKNGEYTGGLFDQAIEALLDRGYKRGDILLASLGGWTFTESGFYIPKDQGCDALLKDQDFNSEYVIQLLKDLQEKRPNSNFVLVTHSLGSIRVLRALERIKDENIDIDVQRLKVVIAHGPNIGINTYSFEWIAAQFDPKKLDEDCDITIGPFDLAIPQPTQINFPALVELKKMWDDRKERRSKLAILMGWLGAKGVDVITLGNANDKVVALGSSFLSEFDLEMAIMMGANPDDLPMYTQYVPGARNVMRFLGHEYWGHEQYFRKPEGLAIFIVAVGQQITRD